MENRDQPVHYLDILYDELCRYFKEALDNDVDGDRFGTRGGKDIQKHHKSVYESLKSHLTVE